MFRQKKKKKNAMYCLSSKKLGEVLCSAYYVLHSPYYVQDVNTTVIDNAKGIDIKLPMQHIVYHQRSSEK